MSPSPLRRPWLQRGLAVVLSVALALAGCAAPRRPPEAVRIDAIVVSLERRAADNERGLVNVWRDGQRLEGYPGMVLQRGDLLESGPLSDVVIRYPGGSAVYMRPASRARIGSIVQAVGTFFAKIKGLFSVETTFVRAAAKGTSYLVRAGTDGATTVIVFEGRVEVDSLTGAWRAVEIGAGEKVLAHPRAPRPVQATVEEMRQTQAWVERIEQLAPETVRTSSEGSSAGATAAALAIGAAILGILLSRDRNEPAPPPAQQREPRPEPVNPTPPPPPPPPPPRDPIVR